MAQNRSLDRKKIIELLGGMGNRVELSPESIESISKYANTLRPPALMEGRDEYLEIKYAVRIGYALALKDYKLE